ncbi:MAG: hypothetical protein ACOY95_03360 [Pseudomonadota bacterium]
MTDSIETTEREALAAIVPRRPVEIETARERALFAVQNPDVAHTPEMFREIIKSLLEKPVHPEANQQFQQRQDAWEQTAHGGRPMTLRECMEAEGDGPASAADAAASASAIQTLNRAFEDGLEALRVCTGEMLSQRTKGKVERAITAMCNAMPILDLVEGVNVKELGGLTTIYQQMLPAESGVEKGLA